MHNNNQLYIHSLQYKLRALFQLRRFSLDEMEYAKKIKRILKSLIEGCENTLTAMGIAFELLVTTEKTCPNSPRLIF